MIIYVHEISNGKVKFSKLKDIINVHEIPN